MEGMEGNKKEEREDKNWPTTRGHVSPVPWGARGPHGGREPLWPWGPRLGCRENYQEVHAAEAILKNKI